MTTDWIEEIPGAAALRDWYGTFPGFHDGYMQFQFNQDGTGWMKLFGWGMTDQVDAQGYIVCNKHFMADFILDEIVSVSIQDFLPDMVIINRLFIRKRGDIFEIDFGDTSYGASGLICAKKVRIEFEPGRKLK